MDPREYDSPEQARVWGPATCSAASLTAVLRARGSRARIADVMAAMPGAITPQRGLVSRPGLVSAAKQFGLEARDDVTSYEALQQATAAGQSVLVDVTNGKFPEGHWLAVTGADAAGLKVADSSGYHLASLSRDEFLAAWSGRGIRIAGPGSGSATALPRGV
jgi:ABC-type bacteriocin/lantibiotic exporter with double-glycine peptidase domain